MTRKLPFVDTSQVNRVLMWVTATDKDDRLVMDLTLDEFEVWEDGKRVPLDGKFARFTREERPLTMAMLLDTSGSMLERLRPVHDASEAFVRALRPIDQAMVIDFDDNVFLVQDSTKDKDEIVSALRSTEALGGTAMFDALAASYRKLGEVQGRKAVLLISDGDDTSSQFSYNRVLDEARANDALVYAIGIGGGVSRKPLKQLAESTGGRAFFVSDAEELGEIYERIIQELGNQYFLSYPTLTQTWDGRWVKLKVDCKRSGIDVRSRKGFFAVKPKG